jgi:outer membrane lipopolysaccharide assembly protein LptE/RlpB
MKGSIRINATADGRPAPDSFCRTAILQLLRALFIALIVGLAGCGSPERPSYSVPPVQISERTWQQVDSDIANASSAATESARDHARAALDHWIRLVQMRTEDDFIPWVSSYWTQRWLDIKMTWYKMGAEEGSDADVKQLAAYLQEQYRERVLDPVAKETDPDRIREQATQDYVRTLSRQLQEIQRRYGVPSDQFDRRLKDIPAIALAPDPAQNASLYQLVHADPIAGLPAYESLIAQISHDAGGTGPSEARISPVAQQTSEKLAARLITSGGASAAAAVVGGIPGVIISLVATGVGAIENEMDRPKLEALLRNNLNSELEDIRLDLMENPATGVIAAVSYISKQIEGSLAKTVTQPVEFEPVPQDIPQSDRQFIQDKNNDDEAPSDNDYSD